MTSSRPGPPLKVVCPNCGYVMEKMPGVPAHQHVCPRCGASMMREDSPCLQWILKQRQGQSTG